MDRYAGVGGFAITVPSAHSTLPKASFIGSSLNQVLSKFIKFLIVPSLF